MLRSPDASSCGIWRTSVLALQRERRVATLAAERARLKQREAIGRTATRWTPNRELATEAADEACRDFLEGLKQRLQECGPEASTSALSSPARAVKQSRQLLEEHAEKVLGLLNVAQASGSAPPSARPPPAAPLERRTSAVRSLSFTRAVSHGCKLEEAAVSERVFDTTVSGRGDATRGDAARGGSRGSSSRDGGGSRGGDGDGSGGGSGRGVGRGGRGRCFLRRVGGR